MLEDSSPRAYRVQYTLHSTGDITTQRNSPEFSSLLQSLPERLVAGWVLFLVFISAPPHRPCIGHSKKWSSTNQRAIVLNRLTLVQKCCDSIGWFCSKHAEKLPFWDCVEKEGYTADTNIYAFMLLLVQ